MAETTLDTILANIARNFGVFVRGTVETGSTTTAIVSKDLIHPNDTFRQCFVRCVNGTNNGAERLVSASAIGRLTCEAFVNTPAVGVTFDVKRVAHADLLNATTDAIRAAGDSWMVEKVDETDAFNSTTQVYSLPPDCVFLLSVDRKMDDMAGGYEWVPVTDFEVMGAPGQKQLQLRNQITSTSTETPTVYTARWHYLALPSKETDGTVLLGYGAEAEDQAIRFIQEYALYLLQRQEFARNPLAEDARARLTLAQQHKAASEEIKHQANMRTGVRRCSGPKLPRHI